MIVKYYCDSCWKEVSDTYELFPIKYETPNGIEYSYDLCEKCMNCIHAYIRNDNKSGGIRKWKRLNIIALAASAKRKLFGTLKAYMNTICVKIA